MTPVNAIAFAPIVTPSSTFAGCWGDNCATNKVAMCALPHEDWKERFGTGSKARGHKVKVTLTPTPAKGAAKAVVCELRHSLPHRANTPGVGIALNPAALAALGVLPDAKTRVTWEFEA